MPFQIKRSVLFGACGVFILLICTVLTYMSVYFKVEQNEFAVVENTVTMQFEPDILSQGVYVLHPFDQLIKFQRTMQNIEIGELECLTGDEVLLQIHVAIRFEYARDALIPIILKKFNTDKQYKTFLIAAMRSSILNSCLQFTALEYYEKRATVDSTMFDNLMLNINEKNLGSNVIYFQLVDIVYPQTYIDILHEKQNVAQSLVTAQNNRDTAIINANTVQLEALRTASINIINAQNTRNITLYNAESQKQAILSQWTSRGIAYKNIMDDLGMSPAQFVKYLNSEVIRTSNKLVTGT